MPKYVMTAPEITPQSPIVTTRIGTGKSLFLLDKDGQPIDGRTILARRFRELMESFFSDLGGEDSLSEAERQLVRRAVTLSVNAELAETYLAGQDFASFDADQYCTTVNVLRRVLTTLGLKRRARDVTPELKHYIDGQSRRVDVEGGDRSVK